VCECDDEEWEEECEVFASICIPDEVECDTDADCPEDFECVANAGGGDCACPACACPDCPPGEECDDCDCPPCDCGDPEEGESFCLPVGWIDAEFWGEQGGSAMSAEDKEEVTDKGGDGDENTGGEESPSDEDASLGDDGGEESESGEEGGGGSDNSGCSVGTTGGPALPFLMLLCLVLALALRRRQVPVRK